MKRPTLLAFSLAANAVLVAIFFYRATPGAGSARPVSGRQPPIAPESESVGDPGRGLATGDNPNFVALLRAADFPPAAIRAAVGARLHEKYAAQIRQVYSLESGLPPYWKSSATYAGFLNEPGRPRARAVLEKTIADELRALIGGDKLRPADIPERIAYNRQYGELSFEKAAGVEGINAEYDFRRREVQGYGQGLNSVISPAAADRLKIAQIESDRQAALSAYLEPREYEDYRIRNSRATRDLPQQLILFEPTEEEYRKIASARLAFDQQYGDGDAYSTTPEQSREITRRRPELEDAIAEALGPARAAEYRATTTGPVPFSRVVARFQLPLSAGREALGVERDIQRQATAIRADNSIAPNDRAAALGALAEQANSRLTAALGKEAFEAYQQVYGSWIAALGRR